VELVERWWNGQFGKMARVDIWVWKDGDTWHVRGRRRGEGGPEVNHMFTGFPAELQARRMSKALRDKTPGSPDRWRDLTDAVRTVNDKYKWGPPEGDPLPEEP
jgi:hypothetical protein